MKLSLMERLRVLASGELPAPVAATSTDAHLREALGATVDADDADWRRLTGHADRDLSPLSIERMQEMAFYLWQANPVANRLIELPVAYLLAEGVSLTAKDDKTRQTLTRFWRDPINAMDIKLPKKVRELALYGEQCWPAFVGDGGSVRLGYLDPGRIQEVVSDPDNAEQPIGIVTKRDKKGDYRRFKVIINGPEDVFTERTQRIRDEFSDGACFFYRVNDLSNGRRGRSDMLSVADWLDGYDQFLFGELERANLLRAFLWDVTLTGADQATVEERAKKLSVPKAGGVRIHNESESWNALSPDLSASDNSAFARLIRNQALGGLSVPEHWYGGGGDVNRATAAEMGEPTFKVLTMRQKTLKHILEDLGCFAIRQRELQVSGKEPDFIGREDICPEAVFPELSVRDTTKYAAALGQVTAACAVAIDRRLLSEMTALRTIATVAERLGIEIDPETELADARAEAGNRDEDDVFTDPPPDPEDSEQDD